MATTQGRTKICHLVYSFHVGGLERVVVNCVNSMDASQFEHSIIALTSVGEFVEQFSVPVQHYSLNKKSGNDLSVYYRLFKLLRQIQPDVLHTYNLATIEYQWVALLARVPKRIHAEHGRDSYDPQGSVKKYQYLRKVCSYAIHKIVAVSEDLRSWLEVEVGIAKKKLLLLRNGIDTDFYSPNHISGLSNQEFTGKVVCGHVARLHSIKNQRLLIEAFANALKISKMVHRDAVLVIVGDGEERESLTRFAAQFDLLKDRLFFVGSQSNVRDYYAQFDLFLLSSLAEGIPMTLLEAMSMGVPHIVTRVGGIGEVVSDNKSGLVVESNDLPNYTKALVSLVEDESSRRRMGEYARKIVVDSYSQAQLTKRYADLYLGRA